MTQVYRPDLQVSATDCPLLTTDPPLNNLFAIPSTLTITLDYGGGCSPSAGITMSGSMVAVLTNIVLSDVQISANFSVTANNLYENGRLVANGLVTGWLRAVEGSGDTLNLTGEANFTNFNAAGMMANGQLSLEINSVDLNNYDLNNIVITLRNFSLEGILTDGSGVLTITTNPNGYHMVITGNTSQGALSLEADVTVQSDSVYIINTTSNGTMAGYTVSFNNVTMDLDRCESNPVSGTIYVSGQGNTYGKTFDGTCNGDWGFGNLLF